MRDGRHRTAWILGAALAAAMACPAVGAAETVAQATELFEGARFEEAERVFEAILAAPSAAVADLALAHLYVAAVRLMAGDEAAAALHLRLATALDAAIALPPGAPLALEAMLREARDATPGGGVALALGGPACADPGAALAVEGAVTGAPPGLAAAVVLRCGGETGWEGRAVPGDSIGFAVPGRTVAAAGEALVCEARLLSTGGAVIRRADLTIPVCEAAAPAPARDETAAQRRRRRRWLWVGVALGAAAAAAAITTGVVLGTAPDEARFGDVRLGGP